MAKKIVLIGAGSAMFTQGLVADVMVGGKWVVRGGRHAAQERAAAEFRAAVAALLA